MSKEAGKTASGPTVVIAIEQYFPKSQRVVEDEIVQDAHGRMRPLNDPRPRRSSGGGGGSAGAFRCRNSTRPP